MILSALALGVALVADRPTGLEAVTDEQLQWMISIEPGVYTWVTYGSDYSTVLLVRAAPPTPSFRRQWGRYENMSTQTYGSWSYRSLVELDEYDCAARRSRALQVTMYAGANMVGATYSPTMAATWTYPLPSTLAESAMEIACKARPAAP